MCESDVPNNTALAARWTGQVGLPTRNGVGSEEVGSMVTSGLGSGVVGNRVGSGSRAA